MSIELNFFPMITETMFDSIGFKATCYEFEYSYEGIKNKLEALPMDGQSHRNEYLQISDNKCEWVPDKHDLCFQRKYTIDNPKLLFGKYGIACENSELGIALLWTSKSSSQRGAKVISGFRQQMDKPVSFRIKASFPPGQLKGSISLQTIIYLKTPGTLKQSERHLANNPGTILGILDEYIIIIDGNGSVFPIVEVSLPSEPLWWVSCDWSDPLVDSFDEENVKIILNKAHPNYKFLKLEDGLKESPMLFDIIASAIQIIIQAVKGSDEWSDIVEGKNMELGSIGHAVNYFITTFKWDPYSPENLARSIRKDFDTRI